MKFVKPKIIFHKIGENDGKDEFLFLICYSIYNQHEFNEVYFIVKIVKIIENIIISLQSSILTIS
jgi:hypothetical protein